MASLPRPFIVSAVLLLGLGTAACTGGAEPTPSESMAPAPTPTPTALPYEMPETVEGEVARSEHMIIDETPSTSSVATAIARANAPLIVEGQCSGEGAATFRMLNATVGAGSALLAEGEIPCSSPAMYRSSYDIGYEGPIQLSVAVPERTDRAWVVVSQE